MKILKGNKCGEVILVAVDLSSDLKCCGEPMSELTANSVDAAKEKHVPVIYKDYSGIIVNVGSIAHPMTEEHHIAWISLHTEQGNQRKRLSHTEEPKAVFALAEGDRPITAYARCNLHGLWKGE